MKPFAIAGVQMWISENSSNLNRMKSQIDKLMAIYPWIQMVVFSELATHGYFKHHAQPLPGPTEAEFCKIAAKHGIWLIPGSIYEKRNEAIFNTLSVVTPTGTVLARYSKMYPFLPYEEGITPGDDFCVFDIPEIGRFGVSICYDMWFPETTRTLAVMGAEVILHPSLTATVDREVELDIVRSSAAINQCYIVDINGVGEGGNGRSIVCGPDGRVIYQAGNSEEILPLEIDLARVQRSRERGVLRLGQPLKSFRDRKKVYDIYQKDAVNPYLDNLGPLIKPKRG